ncbi:MAG: glycosyltransferase [Janthinobacterium lividum]
MSLPASSVPVAVLVLAWDETTPAVRALVEATEALEPVLDSVVVLVPAGPATEELTQEEFLPLEASLVPEAMLALVSAATEFAPAATPAAPEALEATPEVTEATPAPVTVATPLAVVAAPSVASATTPVATTSPLPGLIWELPPAPGAMLPTPGLVGQETFALPGESAVRVLRLSEYSLASLAAYTQQSLPAPTWVGAAAVPAAPYLGSLAVAALLPPSNLSSSEAIVVTSTSVATTSPVISPAHSEEVAAAPPLAPAPAAPSYFTELPVALDAEADSTPVPAVDEPAPVTAADAEESTTELSEEAADELTEPFSVDVTPVQAGWPEALASLQEPAAFTEAEEPIAAAADPVADSPTDNEPVAYATLRPKAQQFDAPNLNFQIIQYARFAVPLALAAQPFGVIYAPAWPTWLAALELRQRTGRPLVLHIATLAAQDEPLALAAGWPAEIQRQTLHQADLILTETPALAYRLRRELDLPAHRVRPVPAADAAAIAQALSTAHVR